MWTTVQRAWARRSTGWGRFSGFGGLADDRSLAAWHRGESQLLQRPVRIDLWAARPGDAREALDAAEAELRRLDDLWNVARPSSELGRVNADAARRPVAVGGDTFALLARAMAFSRASGGAFDLTSQGGDRTSSTVCATGWHRVLLDARDRTVRFDRPGLRLDPAGFGRGLALDQVALRLQQAGIRHAVLRCGHDVRLVGDRRGEPWTVALGVPRDGGRPAPVLPLADCGLATWGVLAPPPDRAGRVLAPAGRDGVVDPTDGRPAAQVHGLAVVAADLAVADALGCLLRVRGAREGLALVDSLPDCEALVVDVDGRLRASAGLASLAEPAH